MKKNNSKADLRVKLQEVLGKDLVPCDSAKCFACDCFREYVSM